jgi:hypothetical protein
VPVGSVSVTSSPTDEHRPTPPPRSPSDLHRRTPWESSQALAGRRAVESFLRPHDAAKMRRLRRVAMTNPHDRFPCGSSGPRVEAYRHARGRSPPPSPPASAVSSVCCSAATASISCGYIAPASTTGPCWPPRSSVATRGPRRQLAPHGATVLTARRSMVKAVWQFGPLGCTSVVNAPRVPGVGLT